MIDATRRWFKRNRTTLAVGAGLLGAGYLAGQYILGKVNETRQRMRDDRIAKEKYNTLPTLLIAEREMLIIQSIACASDSSKTSMTARLRLWLSS